MIELHMNALGKFPGAFHAESAEKMYRLLSTVGVKAFQARERVRFLDAFVGTLAFESRYPQRISGRIAVRFLNVLKVDLDHSFRFDLDRVAAGRDDLLREAFSKIAKYGFRKSGTDFTNCQEVIFRSADCDDETRQQTFSPTRSPDPADDYHI